MRNFIRHIRCCLFHGERHISGKIGTYEWQHECLECRHKWVDADFSYWHKLIKPNPR